MIPPRKHWCIQIEVTNACPRRCSNCTRFVPHHEKPFFVEPAAFAEAVYALSEFPSEGEPHPDNPNGGTKLVGMMGGEPLLHPKFAQLCGLMREILPEKRNRAIFTGLDIAKHKYAELIRETFGYIQINLHSSEVVHQPLLVAVQDIEPNEDKMWALIDDCWVQRLWSSSITPKGFFFCEVAGALDLLFDGPGGLPATPGCWQHDLAEYREQSERWCPRCGACLHVPGRRDADCVDDISRSNLVQLEGTGNPRIEKGEYEVFEPSVIRMVDGKEWTPWRFLR